MNIKKNTDGRRRQRRQRDNILQSVLLNKERMCHGWWNFSGQLCVISKLTVDRIDNGIGV
jgi:uncharacterized protein YeaC (DUF1315 family)